MVDSKKHKLIAVVCGQPEIQLQKNEQEGLGRKKIASVLNLDTLQNEKMGTYIGI